MRNDLTDITFLVDRSGSMSDIKTQVESTMKEIIQSQHNGPGECRLSVYQFDAYGGGVFREHTLALDKVLDCVNINDVKSVTIDPRGGTPLRDALCDVVDNTGKRFASMREEDRPAKVIFVIITDGDENSSTKYTWPDVQSRIKHQEEQYNWLFMYVGCQKDAMKEGQRLGLRANKTMQYNTTEGGMKGLAGSLGGKFSAMRAMDIEEFTSYNSCGEVFDKNDYETQEKSK